MKEPVEKAIEELRAGFPDTTVKAKADPEGGAYVLLDEVDLGPAFSPRRSWISFQITWAYPAADVYPHFIDSSVKYVGEGEAPNAFPEGNLPAAMTRNATAPGFDMPAIQISRASRRRNAETDTALTKLLRILEFMESR